MTETTILVQVQYRKSNPKFGANILTCRNHISKAEIQLLIVWGIFSIIKWPLTPNLLPDIKDFEIIFVHLCSISFFSRQKTYITQRNEQQIEKSFSSNTNTETGCSFRFPILKPGLVRTIDRGVFSPPTESPVPTALWSRL